MERQTKIALRSVIWNVCFYGLCIFSAFYLKDKSEIKNFDVIFVFLPLIFLAIPTESLGIKKFKILTISDFVIKILAYILSQLIYRRIVAAPYFWVCIASLFACCAFSLITSIVLFFKTKK